MWSLQILLNAKKKCKDRYDTNDEGICDKIPEASSSDSGSEDDDPSDSVDPTSGECTLVGCSRMCWWRYNIKKRTMLSKLWNSFGVVNAIPQVNLVLKKKERYASVLIQLKQTYMANVFQLNHHKKKGCKVSNCEEM